VQILWVAESGKVDSSIHRQISSGINRRLLWPGVWANCLLRPQGWRKQSPRYGLRKKDRRGKAGLLVEKRGEKCFKPNCGDSFSYDT
jgi:hypothetical protein